MNKKTIAFHSPTIDERGTCIAIYDYAHFNETILHNSSIIITSHQAIRNASRTNSQVLRKFSKRFIIFLYNDSLHDIDETVLKFCDLVYTIKYGSIDNNLSKKTKNAIHCVFDMSTPHGDIYAGVSQQLANKFNTTNLFVPHMIDFDPDPSISKVFFRRSLNIPDHATVFGRHGGYDTFDISFVKQVISKIVRINPDIYFIFINTPAFAQHSNIIFLNKIIDARKKKEFISSCDAMIHAQSLGESFGLSIAEFSVHQKPIICYGNWVLNDNYRHILKDKAIYYHSEDELTHILYNFDKMSYKDRTDLNCYSEFTPENVMRIFENVFLS